MKKFQAFIALLPITVAGLFAGSLAATASCETNDISIGRARGADSICDVDAEWETDSGKRIKLCDLAGRVRVISMFYATCQGVCLTTQRDMQEIEASLSPEARQRVGFVLVTLDAKRDTQKALRAYRKSEGLSTSRWTLLRGTDAETLKLAALLGIATGRDPAGRFIHSSELIVLDETGRIIHRHAGLRADVNRISNEIESAALPKHHG